MSANQDRQGGRDEPAAPEQGEQSASSTRGSGQGAHSAMQRMKEQRDNELSRRDERPSSQQQ